MKDGEEIIGDREQTPALGFYFYTKGTSPSWSAPGFGLHSKLLARSFENPGPLFLSFQTSQIQEAPMLLPRIHWPIAPSQTQRHRATK